MLPEATLLSNASYWTGYLPTITPIVWSSLRVGVASMCAFVHGRACAEKGFLFLYLLK